MSVNQTGDLLSNLQLYCLKCSASLTVLMTGRCYNPLTSWFPLSTDRLDDVELAGVGAGGRGLCGFVRWIAADAHGQCAVEPDRPAGVS